MSSNLEIDYDQLHRVFALTIRVMADQAGYLGSNTRGLLFELTNNITADQAKQFQDNIKRSHFLRKEIIDYGIVYRTALELVHHPTQVNLDEANVQAAIEHAIKGSQSFLEDFSQFVIVEITTQEEVLIYTYYPLFVSAISSLIVWARLLAPSNNILINVVQTETEIILRVSGYGLSSNQMDFIEQEASDLCVELATFALSVLGASFNWELDQKMPEDELVMYLPKKPPQ